MKQRFALSLTLLALALTTYASAQFQETILHTFGLTTTDGNGPWGSVLFDAQGNIYGTTAAGGANGYGTFFELSPNSDGRWTETILYNFTGGATGSFPHNLAWDSNGNLFGLGSGGNNACNDGCGTIFELSPNGSGGWSEKVVYSFTGKYDGYNPEGPLAIDANGNLFGVTQAGGHTDCGTVFEVSPNGSGGYSFHLLAPFGLFTEGGNPQQGVILDSAGNLYGSLPFGGRDGGGSIYRVSPSSSGTWNLTVIYPFHGPLGATPTGVLALDSAGNLYGTTGQGGKNVSECNGGGGCGVVFKLTPTTSGPWTETILHEFTGPDGYYPLDGVTLDAAGNVWGVADYGGTGNCLYTHCGTAFKLTPAASGGWIYSMIFNFDTETGAFPNGSVTLNGSGNVFGVTSTDGSSTGNGGGDVFELSPQ